MEGSTQFDLIIIGSGPGGYVAAIRAAQLGTAVALVEKSESLGGTCLNIGCIPSKALLASTDHLHFLVEEAERHGIYADDIGFNLGVMMDRKNSIVSRLTLGVAGLMRKNKITVFRGLGIIAAAGKVQVQQPDKKSTTLEAERIIIASGSEPIELPQVPFDGQDVVSSTGALEFSKVPDKLVVAGAGAIGLELGSVWARLGSQVTVVEFLPHIATGFDHDIQKSLQDELEQQGLKFELSTKVTGLENNNGKLRLLAERETGEVVKFEADKVLVAVGRRANTDGLFEQGFSVEQDDKGRIQVDHNFETSVPGIFAIGDVIAGPMLAHKAEEDGVACVEKMAGIPAHIDYNLVPGVVYTSPEAATVGLTEHAAREQGYDVAIGKFPFLANGRALANGDSTGFVKIVSDADTGTILGAHILSPLASDLLAEVVSVMHYKGSAEDIARTIHSHPTLSEAVKEAALAADGRVLHY